MNKKILLLALIVFSSTFGQVQKKFFVEDAQSIEYVTVNFCVNNDAKISEVSIIEEKTTYKNENNIEQLRKYLLEIQYSPDSKLKNNCYDSTFEFINSKYENASLNQENDKSCKEFLTGRFKYSSILYENTIVKRNKKIQREIYEGGKQIYYIKWISDCAYLLTYKRMTEPRLKHLIGKEIHVEIIDILDDGSYVYRSKANFEDKIDYGIIKKIE